MNKTKLLLKQLCKHANNVLKCLNIEFDRGKIPPLELHFNETTSGKRFRYKLYFRSTENHKTHKIAGYCTDCGTLHTCNNSGQMGRAVVNIFNSTEYTYKHFDMALGVTEEESGYNLEWYRSVYDKEEANRLRKMINDRYIGA